MGGSTWGMAKGVTLVPVRVLGCDGSGTSSGVVAGLDWIAANAQLPAVVNMSLGGGASSTIDAAVARLVARGITVVVAGGNDGLDACNYSPAREPSALTVGATASTDGRAGYSNTGTCLDLFAPGSGVTSAWHTGTTATATLSGTSMATPHVAGLVALMLQSQPASTPSQVAQSLIAGATVGRVGGPGAGSPNLLLHTGVVGVLPPPGPIGGGPLPAMTVSRLAGSAQVARHAWRAVASVTVTDAGGRAVAGAAVRGDFSVGGTGLGCTTGTTGSCSIRSGALGLSVGSTALTVTGVTANGLAYDAAHSATQVTIQRP